MIPSIPALSARLQSEVAIHRKATACPYIARLLDAFIQIPPHSPPRLVLVIELVEGRTLLEEIKTHKRLDEPRARSIFVQLLAAVAYLHASGLVHRDIKPENIMLCRGQVKLIDFGLSKHTASARTVGIGTPGYLPPETIVRTTPRSHPDPKLSSSAAAAAAVPVPTTIITTSAPTPNRDTPSKATSHSTVFSASPTSTSTRNSTTPPPPPPPAVSIEYHAEKIDSWALGATLYLMIEGRYPFDLANDGGRDVTAMLRAQIAGKYVPLTRVPAERGVADLIARLLCEDPVARMGVTDAQQHVWVRGKDGAASLDLAAAIRRVRLEGKRARP